MQFAMELARTLGAIGFVVLIAALLLSFKLRNTPKVKRR